MTDCATTAHHTLFGAGFGLLLLLCLASAGAREASAQPPGTRRSPGAQHQTPRPGAVAVDSDEAEISAQTGSIIRLLPLKERGLSGATLVETLLLEPDVEAVVFYLDGEEVERRRLPPWEAKIALASPPREQIVRVEAVGSGPPGEPSSGGIQVLGSDEMIVNRIRRPLAVTLKALTPSDTGLLVEADISVPAEAVLEEVGVFFNETQASTHTAADLTPDEVGLRHLRIELPGISAGPQDFVRVVARLADGRTIDDTSLVIGAAFQEKVEVHLVQLQVLVTNKQGQPLKGLQQKHFTVRENGRDRETAGLFPADDVSLLLGFALDSSGSMRNIWQQTQESAAVFLEHTLIEGDQGFLIDFDTRLRLVQARTDDVELLKAGFAQLDPEGGTALYDSILFSLLQFDHQQGRRGLVVLTDGFDVDSHADPRRAVEFARKLGVPIYILAMQAGGSAGIPGSGFRGGGGTSTLHLLTDPTGGRLFPIRTNETLGHAFSQINLEMRNQYILTYYTDDPPAAGDPPKVTVSVPDMKGIKVKALLGADQIY